MQENVKLNKFLYEELNISPFPYNLAIVIDVIEQKRQGQHLASCNKDGRGGEKRLRKHI